MLYAKKRKNPCHSQNQCELWFCQWTGKGSNREVKADKLTIQGKARLTPRGDKYLLPPALDTLELPKVCLLYLMQVCHVR